MTENEIIQEAPVIEEISKEESLKALEIQQKQRKESLMSDNARIQALADLKEIKNDKSYSNETKEQIELLSSKELDQNVLLTDIKKVILEKEFLNKIDVSSLPDHRQKEAKLLSEKDIESMWTFKQDEEVRQRTQAVREAQNNKHEDDRMWVWKNIYKVNKITQKI